MKYEENRHLDGLREQHEECQYLDLLREIIETGVEKENRTGVNTLSLFARSMRFSLRDQFPLLTTKKMFLKGIIEELLFFLRGETDSSKLEEKGVNIWKGNTTREFLDKNGLTFLPEKNIGCSYSHQWRNFGGEHPFVPETKGSKGFDQVKDVIEKLKNNPSDRRIIINGWCANQIKYAALPPCHTQYTFNVNPQSKELNCHMVQRSVDSVLGLAFNIASMAALTQIMAKVSNLNAGEICWSGVDVHVYKNHIDAVREQISRVPYPFPQLKINKDLNSIEDIEKLEFADFELLNYQFHPTIKAEMVV